MSRKQVLYVSSEVQNRPPRLGEVEKTYYRNVTHLAKDRFGPDVFQAYQVVGYSFKEDSDKEILKMLRYKFGFDKKESLSQFPSDKLYPEDNPVVVIYKDGRIWKYYYHDDEHVELESFDPGIRIEKCGLYL